MIEDILTIGTQGEAISVRRSRPKAHRSALTAAQSLRAKAAAQSAPPPPVFPGLRRSLFTSITGAKSDRLADAQIKAHVPGAGAKVVRNDLFARAGRAGKRVRIKTAIRRRNCPWLAAIGGERGARVELVISSQIRAGCDVVGSTGIGGEEWCKRQLPRRR